MDQQEIVSEIESRAAKLELSISQVCEAAGIYPSTFSRWKLSEKNPKPIGATIKSLNALTTALDRLETQKKLAA
jgi:hypothetical protein